MRATNQVQVVSAQELGDHIFSEGERHAAVVFSPADDVFVRVCPQQVAQQPSVRDVYMPGLIQ